MRRLPLYAAIAGFAIASVLYFTWLLVNRFAGLHTQVNYETVVTFLWPSSFQLMALEGTRSWATTALVLSISFLLNASYYGLFGWVIWWVDHLLRDSKRPISDLNKFVSASLAVGFMVSLILFTFPSLPSVWPFVAFSSFGGSGPPPKDIGERIMVHAIPLSFSFATFVIVGVVLWGTFTLLKLRQRRKAL